MVRKVGVRSRTGCVIRRDSYGTYSKLIGNDHRFTVPVGDIGTLFGLGIKAVCGILVKQLIRLLDPVVMRLYFELVVHPSNICRLSWVYAGKSVNLVLAP